MNDRKLNVLSLAHELFIEKGFQATSIQDILDYTGISKGTFYNYFSSKNELLIAIFKTTYNKMEQERDELLLGKSPASIEAFTIQLEHQMMMNRKNKLAALFEEVLFSDDPEIKQFIREGQIRQIQWFYKRFIDLFGEEKQPYLLDISIMFIGILHQTVKYYSMLHESSSSVSKAVNYSIARMIKMTEEVSNADDQLFSPSLIDNWLQTYGHQDEILRNELMEVCTNLIDSIHPTEEHDSLQKLIEFIQDEVLHTKRPRKFLIESALFTLKSKENQLDKNDLDIFQTLVMKYFEKLGE
ncbi:AcrR family transcriptional regulator [Cytobacillus horneckiae]|uniref:TetR/AcrR family transcriptional regulator n=1 Tax=Cytobacillus horneckiae TaxID=549687 RepID=A0A2N0ZD89_9BACI|nr:TetR/AcrR family transcriptional regulator [Cytobacillus horneckiae]MBN6887344.1 TetR/AcrR family transcriptional regulator [Cytobacillus horneckiae]MCM3178066.1 TetR/AcrR family transcriptional regulator [Cytobacillus horneckiae]MEC1157196.1 TetR/AcrR family transcriptional regulator [Cytobacillus horneckiae]MED2938129.1 TetR/AcrR family transcriptional regulator [Cytobacillus horneckiae]PKG27466.1 TetR/AcrR family transcriptional regulator [Cytobacillus horneckiae]